MLPFIALIVIGGILLFTSGLLTGNALRKRRYALLVETNDILSAGNALVERNFDEITQKHNSLVTEHRTLYDSFNLLRKNLADQEKEQQPTAQPDVTDQKVISDYEKAAFEYAEKIEQLTSAQKENGMLAMQIAVQKKRIADLEESMKSIGELNEITAHVKKLQTENAELRQEIDRLKSTGNNLEHSGKPLSFKAVSTGNNIADVCNKVLESTSAHQNNRGAVIADELGFVIVASSDFADELAGISMLYHYCKKIINNNIVFGDITKITVRNADNLILTIIPFTVNGQTVYYSGLSHGKLGVDTPAGKITGAIIVN
jgi:hypothetical protein